MLDGGNDGTQCPGRSHRVKIERDANVWFRLVAARFFPTFMAGVRKLLTKSNFCKSLGCQGEVLRPAKSY